MDYTQYQYLKVNKYLLVAIGTWPYQTLLQKSFLGTIVSSIIFSQLILQGGGVVTAFIANDIDSFMEVSSSFTISLMCIVKYIGFFYNCKQLKCLMDIMQEDWKIYKKLKNEYNLLCDQYAVGKRFTLYGLASLFILISPFISLPLMTNVADVLGFCNISDRPLAFAVEHFVDKNKYYLPLLIHSTCSTLVFTTIVVAINSITALYVLHEIGLCEILRMKLENFVEIDNMDIDLHPHKNEDKWYQNAKDCVLLHKRIIKFAQILKDATATSYFIQIGLNTICVSFTQYQMVINLTNIVVAIRYASVTICLMLELLFVSWPGQRLMDSTERIFDYATNGKWYLSSMRCRKLLTIMLATSITPMKLTACKFYTLNLENFSAVARSSFSYTMVLYSFQ